MNGDSFMMVLSLCNVIMLLSMVLLSPSIPQPWAQAPQVDGEVVETGYRYAAMALVQVECLLWRHAVRTVEHLPALAEGHIGVAPFVERGVLVAFS